MRCSIRITFKGYRGHIDGRSLGEPLFQIIIFRLAFGQTEVPAVVMDHNADVIRVVERGSAAVERGVALG